LKLVSAGTLRQWDMLARRITAARREKGQAVVPPGDAVDVVCRDGLATGVVHTSRRRPYLPRDRGAENVMYADLVAHAPHFD
jgi:hypothetical protein